MESRDAPPSSDPWVKVNPWMKDPRVPNLNSASFSWSYSRQTTGNPSKPGTRTETRTETTSIPGCKSRRAVSREKCLLFQPILMRQLPDSPVQLQTWRNWSNAGEATKLTRGHPDSGAVRFGQPGEGWMKGKSNFCLQMPTRDFWRRWRQRTSQDEEQMEFLSLNCHQEVLEKTKNFSWKCRGRDHEPRGLSCTKRNSTCIKGKQIPWAIRQVSRGPMAYLETSKACLDTDLSNLILKLALVWAGGWTRGHFRSTIPNYSMIPGAVMSSPACPICSLGTGPCWIMETWDGLGWKGS